MTIRPSVPTGQDHPGMVGAPARSLLRDGHHLQRLATQAVASHNRLRDDVEAAFGHVQQQMVRRELARIPVERVRDVTGGRLRLGALQKHGFRTVLDLVDAGAFRLQRVPGVGETTATQAIAAARQVSTAIKRDLRVRIDLDPSDPHTTALIIALRRYGDVQALYSPVRESVEKFTESLSRALPAAAKARSRARMFFTASARRRAAVDALDWLRQAMAWVNRTSLHQVLTAVAQAIDSPAPHPDAAWKDFTERAPEYYGLLGEIVDLGLDAHAAEGHLPAEIVAAVDRQQLDDQFCRVSLRGYQSFGARFALVQGRVIIGDEMGLGKTIQAIAAIAHLRSLGNTHFLVVCPASVLVNWTREITQRSILRAYRLHGYERHANLTTWLRNGDVAVTTFDTLRTLTVPDGLELGLLVVDEAHFVKNPGVKRTATLRGWTQRARRVLFLTGTPMENRLQEFRNLIHHLRPDLAAHVNGHQAIAGPRAFRAAVAPVYLRRNQEDVLTELPDLIRADEWLEFGDRDLAAYRAAVIAGNFMAMRRAAFDPGDPQGSAKLQRLCEIVAESAENGRKVVVFSFFRAVLDTVHKALGPRCFGPLTGSVPPAERQRIVDELSRTEGHAVLLSQIQAGGVGLNIQAASVVILCEPQVKPTLEDQAVARVHRLGQVRGVQLHRLLTANSVDQRMLEILEQKSQLFDDYARRSDIAAASPEAVDISEVELARRVVAQEQERLALQAIAAQEAQAEELSTEP